MAYEQKEGQGALFKNTEKQKPTHPDYKGDVTIGGAKYWLSAWIKDGKNGKYMSVAATPKQTKTAEGTRNNPGKLEEDDQIPF